MDQCGLVSPVPGSSGSPGNVHPYDAETESPRKTRRRMRPTRLRDDPVHVPSPATADQAVRDLAGAVIYDCRPHILPVSIRLQDFRLPSGVRPAASSSLAAPPAEEATMFGSAVLERAATPKFAAILSDDPGTDLEDELLHVSPLPTSRLFRNPTWPPVPALSDPAPTSQVKELPTIDLFPSYTMSPAHSYYDPAISPIMYLLPQYIFHPGVQLLWTGTWQRMGICCWTVRQTPVTIAAVAASGRRCSFSGVCCDSLSGRPASVVYGCVA